VWAGAGLGTTWVATAGAPEGADGRWLKPATAPTAVKTVSVSAPASARACLRLVIGVPFEVVMSSLFYDLAG
jgi:hypothetical protein